MADVKKSLETKFQPENRFTHFGHVINEMQINGFRGIHTRISFDYPVTALTGFNGSGKSTVGQLMVCGYRRISTALTAKRFYIKDFFPVSVVDPAPFVNNASVEFRYQTDKPNVHQDLKVARQTAEWGGYKRQPERNCEYVGFTVYIPKVERRDLSIYNASSLILSQKSEIENVELRVSQILNSKYETVYFQGVSAKSRHGELGVARRYGATYSENNMGFGEGRVVYTVRLLETCPEQSLVVLEEPETSLHEFAQKEFANYLLDVSNRRGHQIVFSTHSSVMMDALPPIARKLLVRRDSGVEIYDNISSSRIRTALSAGERGHSVICVEDSFAQSLLREMIRRYDKNLLDSVNILPFGDSKAVVSAQQVLRKAGVKAIVVRDGDTNDNVKEGIFKLPGATAPEKDVFTSNSVKQMLSDRYNLDLKDFLTSYPEIDHHDYAETISYRKSYSKEVVESDCIRAFLDGQDETWWRPLCDEIRSQI